MYTPAANQHWAQLFDMMYGVTKCFPRHPFFVSFNTSVHDQVAGSVVARDEEGAWVLSVLKQWAELLLPNYVLLGDPYKIFDVLVRIVPSEATDAKAARARAAVAEFMEVHRAYNETVDNIRQDWGEFTEAYGPYQETWMQCSLQAQKIQALSSVWVKGSEAISLAVNCRQKIDEMVPGGNRKTQLEMTLKYRVDKDGGLGKWKVLLLQKKSYRRVVVGAFSNKRYEPPSPMVPIRSGLKGKDVIDFIQEPLMDLLTMTKPSAGFAPSSLQSEYEKELHLLKKLCDACTLDEDRFQFASDGWREALKNHTEEYKKYSKVMYNLMSH